jgi:biotin carboxyl carrier protein
VQIFEASDWDQIELIVGDVNLHLSKTEKAGARLTLRSGAAARELPALGALAADPPTGDAPTEKVVPPASLSGLLDIAAPHVATFFRAAKSGARPLIEVGQDVGADTEVCRLEVMKRSISLRAGVVGVLREIHATDGVLVEGGQILFRVEPNR